MKEDVLIEDNSTFIARIARLFSTYMMKRHKTVKRKIPFKVNSVHLKKKKTMTVWYFLFYLISIRSSITYNNYCLGATIFDEIIYNSCQYRIVDRFLYSEASICKNFFEKYGTAIRLRFIV